MKKLFFAAIAVVMLAGCAKEVEGPAGPQGPQGEQGNANVSSITWTTNSWDWFGASNTGWETSNFWSAIDQEMLNGGLLQVYAVVNGTHLSLPYTAPSGSSFVSVASGFSEYTVSVALIPGQSVLLSNPGVKTYKAVAVAPKALAMGDEYVQRLINEELKK